MNMSDNNFYRKLFYIALPIMIRTTIGSFSGFIDNLMVGQLGVESISAVAIINQILFVFICSITGAIAGATIFSTQYFGVKDYEGVKKVFFVKFAISIVVFAVYSLFVYIFYEQLISLFMTRGQENIKQNIMSLCSQYFPLAFFSLVAFWITNIFATTMSESGDTLRPMVTCLACTLLNTLLNYIFINGHMGFNAMGIYGAALSTCLSRFIEMIIVILLFFRNSIFSKFFFKIEINTSLLKKIFTKSVPLFLDDFLYSFSFVVGMQIYSLKDINNITIMSVASIINVFFVDLIVAVGIAAEIILGYELGQKNLEKANIYALKIIKIAMLFGVLLSSFIYLLALYVPYFYNIDQSLQIDTTKCIQMFALTFTITCLASTTFFIIRSGGNTLLLAIIDGIFIWVVQIPLQYILIKTTSWSLPVIYFIVLSSSIIRAIAGLILIKKKMWMNNLISNTNEK